MSRVSARIAKSGYTFEIVREAVIVLGEQLRLPWTEYLEEIVQPEGQEDSGYRVEHVLDCLFQKGEIFLNQVQGARLERDELLQHLNSQEEEDENFAREMSALRRAVSRKLSEAGEEVKKLAYLDTCLDYMHEILSARNASPLQPLMEENIYVPIGEEEKELGQNIASYIKKEGWETMPIGEREETILCLSQHFFATREFGIASDLLVDAMEAGIRDPLVYYAYFVLGVAVDEFEAAMEGYKVSVKAMPVLSLAPQDRYEIKNILSKNRMEISCKGLDTYTKQPVSVKILLDPPASVRDAIQDYSKLKQHSRICSVLNFHEINPKRPCLVMEYLDAPSVEKYVEDNGPFPANQCVELALQIVGSMAHAHGENIVHGNIAPSQLIWDQGEIKINNFGLFPLADWPLPINKKDLPGMYYIAPELLEGDSLPTTSGDVYSLAMTIYFMLTGEPPYPMQSKGIPSSIWAILLKATNRSAELRYLDATEMLKDLAQTSKEPMTLDSFSGEGSPVTASANKVVSLNTGERILLPEQFIYRNGIVSCQADNSEMLIIPSGSFSMGSNERVTESPMHEVFLGNYLIDKFPVTNAQYERFLEYIKQSGDHSKCHPEEPKNKDHTPKGWKTSDYIKYSGEPDHPVIFVDWWDAWAFAQWAGKTLATEAQWEKAARGTDNRIYPWGDEEPTEEVANFANHTGGTTQVGQFSAGVSPYGCLDMSGNVWEWCLDTYDKAYYQNSPKKNPANITDKPSRTLRGGSWNDPATTIRASCRGCWVNIVRYSYIGFRCAYLLENR